jgi:hypothetical protein
MGFPARDFASSVWVIIGKSFLPQGFRAFKQLVSTRQKPTAKSRKALKKFKSDPTHSTPRTTLWARVKDLPRSCRLRSVCFAHR